MTYHICWKDERGRVVYGQSGLSERQARADVEYLRSKGIDAWYEPDHEIA